jgi:hypothetical protein
MLEPLKTHFGAPVSGDKFFSRPYPVNLALNTLKDDGSVALFGPRRTGKSSILKEVARLLREEGFHPIEIDLQGRSGPASFASNILKAIPKDMKTTIVTGWAQLGGLPTALLSLFNKDGDGQIPADEATEALFREYWEALSDVVQTQILKSTKKIVLFLDELPYFCEQQLERGASVQNVDDFLATLRRWRQAGIPMAIAGSIGMRHVLRKHRLSPDHLNDLTAVPLRPLSHEHAVLMLKRLAATSGLHWWQDEHAEVIIAEAPDLLPSYLQKAFATARALDAPDPMTVVADLRRDVRGQFEAGFFDQYNKRLARYVPEAHFAKAVLSLLLDEPKPRTVLIEALRAAGASSDHDAGEFLQEMIEDGFIAHTEAAGQYALAFKMVESWWRQRS